jgi:glycosyltransferase involved in cell wall biosynthesis
VSEPRVSIIVCTHDRSSALPECLRSILADPASVSRELIVVDNASTDETKDVVAEVADGAPVPVRYVYEPRLGKSYALNAGVAHALGEVLLFTDDDVRVEEGWTDALAACFRDPRVGGARGRTIPVWPAPPPSWLDGPAKSIIAFWDPLEAAGPMPPEEILIGCNMAIRREALHGIEPPFHPDLGHQGGRYIGAEDVEVGRRISRSWTLWWTPDARVRHAIEPDRMTWPSLRRQYFGNGIGVGRVERHLWPPRLRSFPIRLLRFLDLAVHEWAGRGEDRDPRDAFEAHLWMTHSVDLGRYSELAFGRFPRAARWVERKLETWFPWLAQGSRAASAREAA